MLKTHVTWDGSTLRCLRRQPQSGLRNESGQRVSPETEHLKPAAISNCAHWVADLKNRVSSFPESPFFFNVSDLRCFTVLGLDLKFERECLLFIVCKWSDLFRE